LIDRKIGFGRQAALRNTGIVDEAIDAPAPGPGLFDQRGNRIIVGRLERQDHRARAAILCHRFERSHVAARQDQPRAARRKAARQCRADTRRSPRNPPDLIFHLGIPIYDSVSR
jgi:hypothetical protein